jgi:glycosyltransferase involved in cell wall biosynthesis
MSEHGCIAVVIPCYRVGAKIDGVLAQIPKNVSWIYCIDDACPEKSGDYIERTSNDPRVRVLYHSNNQGVGGAVITGFDRALADGADIIVKIDGDGQMDPQLLPCFTRPILSGEADYTKGNRFYWIGNLEGMPPIRIVGNAILSFLTKLSTGYWNIFDPTNGYIAIHSAVLRALPYKKISKDFFFESDMLYQLGAIQAVVKDVPMIARYEDEQSNLSVRKVVRPFVRGHMRNLVRRIIYTYYLRDFNLASLELLIGALLLIFGVSFSAVEWTRSILTGSLATAGTVMIGGLSIIVGVQMLLGGVNYDMQRVPRSPLHATLPNMKES